MKSEKLVEIIQKLIQREVRKEMQHLKVQILSELKQGSASKNPLSEINRNFRQNVQSIPGQKNIQYSRNPVLNELLRSTSPVPREESSYIDLFKNEDDIINVPTDQSGRPMVSAIKSGNKGVNAVVEAMNRNYSGVVQRMDEDKGKIKQQFKEQIVSRMEVDNDEPDEDFSFLDGVS